MTHTFLTRFSAALGCAAIGAICGGMLASFCAVISSSTTGVVVTIVIAAMLGAMLGRFGGAINGAILGGMLTALASVVAGSTIGTLVVVLLCVLLGGWLRWHSQERWNAGVTPQSLPSVAGTGDLPTSFVRQPSTGAWTIAAVALHRTRWNRGNCSRAAFR